MSPPRLSPSLLRRISCSAALLLLPLLLRQVSLPGLNIQRAVDLQMDEEVSKAFTMQSGLVAWLEAALLVELVAVLVPRLRNLRFDPQGRARLRSAQWLVALLLLGVQAAGIVLFLRDSNFLGGQSWAPYAVVAGHLLGPLLTFSLCAWVARTGVAGAASLLVLGELGAGGWSALRFGAASDVIALEQPPNLIVVVCTLLLLLLPLWGLPWLSKRMGMTDGLTITFPAGIVPLQINGGLFTLLATYAAQAYPIVLEPELRYLSCLLLTPLLALAFHPPAARDRTWATAFVEPAAARRWFWSGTSINTAWLFGIAYCVNQLLETLKLDFSAVQLLAALLIPAEIMRELRFRRERAELVHVASFPALLPALALLHRLRIEQIPSVAQNLSIRVLSQAFGQFAPIDILVAPEHAPFAGQLASAASLEWRSRSSEPPAEAH